MKSTKRNSTSSSKKISKSEQALKIIARRIDFFVPPFVDLVRTQSRGSVGNENFQLIAKAFEKEFQSISSDLYSVLCGERARAGRSFKLQDMLAFGYAVGKMKFSKSNVDMLSLLKKHPAISDVIIKHRGADAIMIYHYANDPDVIALLKEARKDQIAIEFDDAALKKARATVFQRMLLNHESKDNPYPLVSRADHCLGLFGLKSKRGRAFAERKENLRFLENAAARLKLVEADVAVELAPFVKHFAKELGDVLKQCQKDLKPFTKSRQDKYVVDRAYKAWKVLQKNLDLPTVDNASVINQLKLLKEALYKISDELAAAKIKPHVFSPILAMEKFLLMSYHSIFSVVSTELDDAIAATKQASSPACSELSQDEIVMAVALGKHVVESAGSGEVVVLQALTSCIQKSPSISKDDELSQSARPSPMAA